MTDREPLTTLDPRALSIPLDAAIAKAEKSGFLSIEELEALALSQPQAGEPQPALAVKGTPESILEDAAKSAFVKAQSVYRSDHDHFPLKSTWETTSESIREGWRSIAYAAVEAAYMPPLGTQPEPRQPRDVSALVASPPPSGEVEALSVQDPMMILAGIKQFGLASDGSDLRDLEAAVAALVASPQPALTVKGLEDVWLITNGPDGQCSKVVAGLENLKREVVAAVFGDPNDASEEAQDMRDRLDTSADWEGDHWSISWSFEDGYLNVQRITDRSALVASLPPSGKMSDDDLVKWLEDSGANVAWADDPEHHLIIEITPSDLRSALSSAPATADGWRDGLSEWAGWDQDRHPWGETKHKDEVLEALFRAPWSVEDAATLIGFIERTWPRLHAAPTATGGR